MGIFSKAEKKKSEASPLSASVQTGSVNTHPFSAINSYVPIAGGSASVYRTLRESIPIIDSAIDKIIRLMGGFQFKTGDDRVDMRINEFFSMINVGGNQTGISAFVDNYMGQLLTYGSAVGEMLYDSGGLLGLYNADLTCLAVKRKKDSLDLEFFNSSAGTPVLIEEPWKVIYSVLNPEPDKLCGTSILRGLPFVSDILLKIYNTIGVNWERVGNLRYAVTYNPQSDSGDRSFAKERANRIAESWRDAMSSTDCIKDFVAVGDVRVSVIGADNQILDSEIPVRQMLEQIIAKTGLMPYMFGLNWSTSERMAKQQTDILTTELEAYRRIMTPVLKKIGNTYLSLEGIPLCVDILWDEITLQDETELAQARLYNAEADKLLREADDE